MLSDAKLIAMFKKQRNAAKRGLAKQYDNTRLCQSYYNDTDSSYTDTVQFAEPNGRKRRAQVNIKKIPQNIDAVVGFMAQNRRQAKYTARVNQAEAMQLYSRNMNELYGFHREAANADQVESKQDLDLIVNGFGAVDTDLSYIVGNATTMPGGEILKTRIDPLLCYWDSTARAANILDSRYRGYFEDYGLQDALDLFQASKSDDFERVSAAESVDDGSYQYNPWGGLYSKIKMDNTVDWADKDEETVRVYKHEWYEYETFYRAANPLYSMTDPLLATTAKMQMDMIKSQLKSYNPEGINAGDLFDFDPLAPELTFDAATKSKLEGIFGAELQAVGFKRKCYYTAVLSGSHVFNKFKSICQQGFGLQFKTGNFNERGKYWIGMVNAMIEPQKYYNKALTELMFTIAANSKGGVMVERTAVEDVAEFETKWAKTDAVIVVEDGAIANARIQQKTQAALPTGLENIINLSDAAISSNGVDPAFLGQSNAQETGVLYKRRIKQIISKMWWVADSITLYQKEDARLCADLIRVWVDNNTGVWFKITGEDGKDEFLAVSADMLVPQYDITIQEGAQSPEDKQETAILLSQIGDKYLQIGNQGIAGILYAESLQMMSLDGDVKARMSAALNPDQQTVPMAQYQQLQQQLANLQSQLTQAQVGHLMSQTAVNQAKTAETAASTKQKEADAFVKVEEAHQKNIETQIIRRMADKATVNI